MGGELEGSRFDSKGSDHQSSSALPAVSAVLKGSGWRRADRRAVSAHLLFPPVLAPPPRRDITGPSRSARCWQALGEISEASWGSDYHQLHPSPPPPPPRAVEESALSSRNPILSPHWPAAVDGWRGGRWGPIRKRDEGRNGCFCLRQRVWGGECGSFHLLEHPHTHKCNKGESMKWFQALTSDLMLLLLSANVPLNSS